MQIKESSRSKFYIALTTVLSGVIMIFYAAQLSVPVIGDETTTMANAAFLTGRDWSLMIGQLGGLYYKYIQALMTVPFFDFLKDPDQIYRASMILQALIQVSTIPIIYLICRRHLKMKSSSIACLIAAAVCFVPSIALYVLYYRGDYLLSVLPWYVLLFFLETVRAAKEQKRGRRIVFTLLSVFCCVLAYMAHTRGIVLIIALILTALLVRLLGKQRSLHWPVCIALAVMLLVFDYVIGGGFKQALYSISGVNANSFESVNMGSYFNVFSYQTIKSIGMLCISWLNTLTVTTEGLVLIGGVIAVVVAVRLLMRAKTEIGQEEKITILFSFLVFAGYFAVGAFFFKNHYVSLATGATTKRVDHLLYDRYSICGAGMLVFLALYVLICKRKWLSGKIKVVCGVIAASCFGIFLWKILPLVGKYTGYIYNSITLNTFNTVEDPSTILSGAYYGEDAVVLACILGLAMMAAVLVISALKKSWMPYVLLAFVLICDLVLIQVNYGKIRKASNDYVIEATEDVVDFLQGMEDEITEEYPYVLKGGLSGTKIQFYQSQLMNYILFGKKQEEMLDLDDYFIISKNGDIDLTWYDEDYYLFEDYDYDNADYDIVYVKGDDLAERLEELGYEMMFYEPENAESVND